MAAMAGIYDRKGRAMILDEEWMVMIDFAGGMEIAGGKLKESGTTHWINPNTGAVNEYNFMALPAGQRIMM